MMLKNFSVFHQGFLHKVTNELPYYVTLGQIGFHLGHELLKFVDLEQSKNDKDEIFLHEFKQNTAMNKKGKKITIEGFDYEFMVITNNIFYR